MSLQPEVTLLRPGSSRRGSSGLSGSLPPDLLEQVRKRVALLALLLSAAFALDPAIYLATWASSGFRATAGMRESYPQTGFLYVDAGAVLASLLVWRAARSPRVPASRLHGIGLIYEVAICLTLGIMANWYAVLEYGHLPELTWIPTVVMFFPLILPGPPRRMLVAAIIAGAMGPFSIFLLQMLGKIGTPSLNSYSQSVVASGFGVLFAWTGAKVIYGLGRELVAARELGSYQLDQRLGQGGMGEVWRARHRLLARPAAIKLIRPALAASPEVLQRFEREAQAIAGLRSQHTVTLFDFGVAADGAFYYVMELLDGLDAERLVRRFGPLPAARVIHVLRQMCHSLAEAESRGLVHRDIKPANVFLCRYGQEYDFVKVLDFGIVKALGEPAQSGSGLTRENTVPGSPQFMAPEQAMGEADVDSRADLYATGCVAYWLLTGQTVFAGDSPMSQILHHANTPPTPPSTRTDAPIPPALERIVMQCLAKDPAARPRSARELARGLAEIADGHPWTEEQSRAWWERHASSLAAAEPA